MQLVEIRGIGVSGKKASGKAFVYEKKVMHYHCALNIKPQLEKERLMQIIQAAEEDIISMKEIVKLDDENCSGIFESHKWLLEDKDLQQYVLDLIDQGYDLLSALVRTKEDMKIHFLNMKNELFRSKVTDIEDVFERLIDIETGYSEKIIYPKTPFILICDEILPSLVYQISTDYLKGIIVRFGSNCSSGTLLARTRNIPVIIRIKNRVEKIENNQRLTMNGESGTIYIID